MEILYMILLVAISVFVVLMAIDYYGNRIEPEPTGTRPKWVKEKIPRSQRYNRPAAEPHPRYVQKRRKGRHGR